MMLQNCNFFKTKKKRKNGILFGPFWNVLIEKFDLSVQPSVKFIIY